MSITALNKSTLIAQFKEHYRKSITELSANPKYVNLNINNYVDKYKSECSFISTHKEIIQSGSFGEIYECHVDTLHLIVKRIPVYYPFKKYSSKYNIGINNNIESGQFYSGYIDNFLNEVLINIILQNENKQLFCPLVGFNFTEDTQNKEVLGYFFIIMEHCGHSIKNVSFSDLLPWFIEIAQALQIMHSKNIVHNDIANRNILLINSHIRVIDFGMSEITDDTDKFKRDIYLFNKMLLDTITYITDSDDLGPFTPLQPILSNLDNSDLYPSIEHIISELITLHIHFQKI